MTLIAAHPFKDIPELVYVIDPALPGPANVVAKANTKHGNVWRTNHDGPKRPMSEIRSALATA